MTHKRALAPTNIAKASSQLTNLDIRGKHGTPWPCELIPFLPVREVVSPELDTLPEGDLLENIEIKRLYNFSQKCSKTLSVFKTLFFTIQKIKASNFKGP